MEQEIKKNMLIVRWYFYVSLMIMYLLPAILFYIFDKNCLEDVLYDIASWWVLCLFFSIWKYSNDSSIIIAMHIDEDEVAFFNCFNKMWIIKKTDITLLIESYATWYFHFRTRTPMRATKYDGDSFTYKFQPYVFENGKWHRGVWRESFKLTPYKKRKTPYG